jgi:hypothetical protein
LLRFELRDRTEIHGQRRLRVAIVRLPPGSGPADRGSKVASGQWAGPLSFITVEAVDAGGRPHPNADHQVTCSLQGPGAIAGVGNGDLTTEEPTVPGQPAEAVSR